MAVMKIPIFASGTLLALLAASCSYNNAGLTNLTNFDEEEPKSYRATHESLTESKYNIFNCYGCYRQDPWHLLVGHLV